MALARYSKYGDTFREILLTLLSDSEFEFGIPPAKTMAGDKIRADSINKRLNISTRSSKNNYYL